MFHEPYVELIDNNGNNPNEVEKLWRKKAHWPDQMVLFCLVFFSSLKKQKINLTFSVLFITWGRQSWHLLANPGVFS